MADIPNPLRSGEFTLDGGTYTGDVGSLTSTDPTVLNLRNGATANVTVEGLGDPTGPGGTAGNAHFAVFEVVQGHDTIDFQEIGGGRSPFGQGFATVNLNPNTVLTSTFNNSIDGHLTINGAHGSKLKDFSGTSLGGDVTVNANIRGTGIITLTPGPGGLGGNLSLNGTVGRGETIDLRAGHLLLGEPFQFLGSIDWSGGADPTQRVTLGAIKADSFSYDGAKLHLFVGREDFLDVPVSGLGNPSSFEVAQTSAGVAFGFDLTGGPNFGVPLPIHQSPTA